MKTQSDLRILSLFLLLVVGFAVIQSCTKEDPTPPASAEKTITALSFDGVVQGASVDIKGTNITVTVPYGTDITALAPTITLPKGATISPASGVKQNFTKPVTYTVTAEDGTKQTFTVTVTQGLAPKSTAKEIKGFVFKGFTPAISATIDSTAKTITATLPPTADLTKLVPEIKLSDKATVSPASGAAQDFSKDVTYIVTAEDGSTKTFVVSLKKGGEVTVNPNDLPDFSGSLLKSIRLYHPLFPGDDVVLKYNYKNKKLDQIIHIETSKYIQSGKEIVDIKGYSLSLKYSGSKIDYIYDADGTVENSVFYTEENINYIDFKSRDQYKLDYENEKINKIIYQELNKDIGEYIRYEYDRNGNMTKLHILDKTGIEAYTVSLKYDTRVNAYKNINRVLFYDIFSYITEFYDEFPFFIFQNENNITEMLFTDNKDNLSANYTFNYTGYNIHGYPTKVKISGKDDKGKESDYDGGVIEFEYHSK